MPAHNIIDNRREKLVDHINRILETSEAARFAVGYFFLSGLTAISEKLSHIKELRLLIGNTTNRETLEQIAEGVLENLIIERWYDEANKVFYAYAVIARREVERGYEERLRTAVESGRLAFEAGRIPRKLHGQASTTDTGLAEFRPELEPEAR